MRQFDIQDTIVAVASAPGPSERGVVRVSGHDALAIAERLTGEPIAARSPRRLGGRTAEIRLADAPRHAPVDLLVWPDKRSYTRQPAVEIHAPGSPPVLEAIARACRGLGARAAEPGEFTMRAFLAGRLDLTQAEAVLSVIDARESAQLGAALDQMAGGLSAPLKQLRKELLGLLADLEAGLDFVEEEDVRFVSNDELLRRLANAADLVALTAAQMSSRDSADRPPRVALTGAPNVGKSTLFNALVERFGGQDPATRALVADQPGVTRDALTAVVELDGLRVELIDTAGDDASTPTDAIERAARDRATEWRDAADLVVTCAPATRAVSPPETGNALPVATMCDLAQPHEGWTPVSGATGAGLDDLAGQMRDRVTERSSSVATTTAQRCRDGLHQAAECLRRAVAAAEVEAGEELVSLELREALDGLGRVVGEVVTDEVLGEIFGRFCIGK